MEIRKRNGMLKAAKSLGNVLVKLRPINMPKICKRTNKQLYTHIHKYTHTCICKCVREFEEQIVQMTLQHVSRAKNKYE